MRVAILLLLLCSLANAAKIIVYSPVFGYSHMNFFGQIADILTEAGHQVTVLQPVIDMDFISKTGVKLTKDVIRVDVDERTDALMKAEKNGTMKEVWTLAVNPVVIIEKSANMSKAFSWECEKVLKDKTLMAKLKNAKYDLGIFEPFDICGAGIYEAIGIPSTIAAHSSGIGEVTSIAAGVPMFPSFVPGMITDTGDKMGFLGRMGNAVGTVFGFLFFHNIFKGTADVFRSEFGNDFKDYPELISQASFIFANTHPLLDFPRPLVSKVVQIGGISVSAQSDKTLSKEWDELLSKRKRNVLLSFGTVVKSKDMPEHYKAGLLELMKQMPDTTFIWKYEVEGSDIAKHLPNVHLAAWIPQVELLNDPRLSVFISHGGLGSATETAYLGVPSLLIPVFADQARNALMLQRQGTAIKLDKENLDKPSVIKEALNKIMDDPSYRANAKRLSEMLKQSPQQPKDLLIKYVDFAARFGKLPNLEPYGRNLNYVQYHLIDVMAFLILTPLVVFYLLYRICRKMCCSQAVVEKKKKKE